MSQTSQLHPQHHSCLLDTIKTIPVTVIKMPIIPARKVVAFSLQNGQEVQIINTHGKQVLNPWAFNPSESNDFLSMVHSRTVLRSISLSEGGKLYSTQR